jgi:hypothetical protein
MGCRKLIRLNSYNYVFLILKSTAESQSSQTASQLIDAIPDKPERGSRRPYDRSAERSDQDSSSARRWVASTSLRSAHFINAFLATSIYFDATTYVA